MQFLRNQVYYISAFVCPSVPKHGVNADLCNRSTNLGHHFAMMPREIVKRFRLVLDNFGQFIAAAGVVFVIKASCKA